MNLVPSIYATKPVFSLISFRNINYSLGYDKGDRVLQEVAQRLAKFAEDGSIIARFDGGKFALFSPRKFDIRQSKTYVKGIKQVLTQRVVIDDGDIVFRISVGVVLDVGKYDSMTQCLRNASVALVQTKRGNGQISLFNEEMLA